MSVDVAIKSHPESQAFAREYHGHLIHRAPWEKTWTVWRNGRCIESGLYNFIACMDWIEEHKHLDQYQIGRKRRGDYMRARAA